MKRFSFVFLAALMCVASIFAADTPPTEKKAPGALSYRVSAEIALTGGETLKEAEGWFGAGAEYVYFAAKGFNPMVAVSAGIGLVSSSFKYEWANGGIGISKTEKELTYSLLVKSSISEFLPQLVGYIKTPLKLGDGLSVVFSASGGIYLPIGDMTYSFPTKERARYAGFFVEPQIATKIAGFNVAFSINYTETNQVVLGDTYSSWKGTLYVELSPTLKVFGAYATDPWKPEKDGIIHIGLLFSSPEGKKTAVASPVTATP